MMAKGLLNSSISIAQVSTNLYIGTNQLAKIGSGIGASLKTT